MEFKTNKKACCDSCSKEQPLSVKASLASNVKSRSEKLEGREYLVIPVIMAKAGVVMNGNIFLEEEMHPEHWDGVPVTLRHPEDSAGDALGANSPEAIEKFSVGRMFNCAIVDGDLRGEAWIEIKKASKLDRKILSKLRSMNIDVSTGLFSEVEQVEGKSLGQDYQGVYRSVNPDHLALLPDGEGACNWADGCGIRSNSGLFSKAYDELKIIANKLGINISNPGKESDLTKDEMVSNLISSESTPFKDVDSNALHEMEEGTLKMMAEQFGSNPEENAEGDEPEENAEGDEPEENAEGDEDGDEMKSNAKKSKAPSGLSKEDRKFLAFAKRQYGDQRSALLRKIEANSNMKSEALKGMDVDQLEVIANGLKIADVVPIFADYSGRPMPQTNSETDASKEEIAAMAAGSFIGNVVNMKKEAA